MWDFEHTSLRREFDISYTVPSLCAEALRTGAADIGIIPAVAYAGIPGLVLVPDVAIAAKNSVRSILLVSKAPLEKINSVATDSSSRTSVALAQILFQRWYGGERRLTSMQPDLEKMMATADAALLIGDSALRVDRAKYYVYDLAAEWRHLTGKPFVFAFWAVREAALQSASPNLDLAGIFQGSRDHGLQPKNLDTLAREWSPRIGLTPPAIKEYLTRNIDYALDADNLEGLELFFRYAAECGLIAHVPHLRFMEAATPAKT